MRWFVHIVRKVKASDALLVIAAFAGWVSTQLWSTWIIIGVLLVVAYLSSLLRRQTGRWVTRNVSSHIKGMILAAMVPALGPAVWEQAKMFMSQQSTGSLLPLLITLGSVILIIAAVSGALARFPGILVSTNVVHRRRR